MTSLLRLYTWVGSATVLSSILGILLVPVVLVYYDQAEFGNLALVLSFATIAGTLATGRLELLIPNSSSNISRLRLFLLANRLSTATLVFASVFIWLAFEYIFQRSTLYTLLALLACLSLALQANVQALLLSKQQGKPVSIAKIAGSIGEPLAQIALAYLILPGALSANKLVLAFLVIQLLRLHIMSRSKLHILSLKRYKNLLKQLKTFRRYIFISQSSYFLNSVTTHGVVLLFIVYYSVEDVANFSVMQRTAGALFFLVSTAFTQFFFALMGSGDGQSKAQFLAKRYTWILITLMLLNLIIFVTIQVNWELLESYLPSNWIISADFRDACLLLFLVQATVVPVSSFLNMQSQADWQMKWEGTRFIAVLALFTYSAINQIAFDKAFTSYAQVMVVFYLALVGIHFLFLRFKGVENHVSR